MTTKLIVGKSLTPEMSFFNQDVAQVDDNAIPANPFVRQPTPSNSNLGNLRPVCSSNLGIGDFTFSGTTTTNGAVGGTTVVDTSAELKFIGDDFLIGGKVTINSGAASGETKDISDYVRSTGTITTAAFSAQIVSGVSYTITIPYISRDIILELTNGGDPQNASFRWSHNGGTTYLGRETLDGTTWYGGVEVADDVKDYAHYSLPVIVANDGTWFLFYQNSANYAGYKTSIDGGLTWSSFTVIPGTYNLSVYTAYISPTSGRIFVSAYLYIYYSDNNGATWQRVDFYGNTSCHSIFEHPDGYLLGAYHGGTFLYCMAVHSYDNGLTWGSPVTMATRIGVSTIYGGNFIYSSGPYGLMFFYRTVPTSYNEIYFTYFDEASGVWVDDEGPVIADNPDAVSYPSAIVDLNGDIYCVAVNVTDSTYLYSMSDDGGETWSADQVISGPSGGTYNSCGLSFPDGHSAILTVIDRSNNTLKLYKRGHWLTYSEGTNDCYVPMNALKQRLINNIDVQWYGGNGRDGDIWTFGPDFLFAPKNILSDSPAKQFRTTGDSVDAAIFFDLGETYGNFINAVGLFGCNVRQLTIKQAADDSFGTPTINQTVSFDIATGDVETTDSGYIDVPTAITDFADFELSGAYLRGVDNGGGGSEAGNTYKIKYNLGGKLYLEGDITNDFHDGDAIAIFGGNSYKSFTGANGRYLMILIETQTTAEGFYKIGSLVAGMDITLTRTPDNGFNLTQRPNVDYNRNSGGGIFPIRSGPPVREWSLNWKCSQDTRDQIIAMSRFIDGGQNICFVPDSAIAWKSYLVKNMGDIEQRHWVNDKYHVSFELTEVP
jgi:hypothetical protein